MDKTQQRIKIAEACGWTRRRSPLQNKDDPHPRGWVSKKNRGDGWKTVDAPPDYLNDLNAMHEVEKVLTHVEFRTYHRRITDTCGFKGCIRATAEQRAEAFLKTLGLWEDEA